jgi:hypothetical protein
MTKPEMEQGQKPVEVNMKLQRNYTGFLINLSVTTGSVGYKKLSRKLSRPIRQPSKIRVPTVMSRHRVIAF